MEEIEERVLELVRRARDGILQSQLWKELGINSRQGVRTVRTLLDEGLVERESIVAAGVRACRIRFTGVIEEYVPPTVPDSSNYELLIAGGVFVPCVGCIDECKPSRCIRLNRWVRGLGAES